MSAFITEIRETIVPGRNSKDGPLPPLLVAMTVATGLVDAFSYLVLGHVFVANMTGNVVFLAFAVAGVHGFSIGASLVALASSGLGSVAGGRIAVRLGHHRGRHTGSATGLEVVFVAAAVALAAAAGGSPSAGYRYGLIVLLAAAMGVQNATARKLAIADLTTTVLTMTITGIAADSTIAGGAGAKAGRRLIAVSAMLCGALAGAVLVLHVGTVYPVAIALIALSAVAVTTLVLGRSDPDWVRGAPR